MSPSKSTDVLAPDLGQMLARLQQRSPAITTVAEGRPNWITGVKPTGVWIETEASRAKGTGPQLVPAWMINVAWDHLRSQGSLEQRFLLATDGLNVKRSAAVMALLARLPGVTVASSRPSRLSYSTSPKP